MNQPSPIFDPMLNHAWETARCPERASQTAGNFPLSPSFSTHHPAHHSRVISRNFREKIII
jgi:hypothetical protein